MKIFPIFHWHPLLERHFPIRSGTLKPVQQAALEIPQPRHDSQGSDGTRAVWTPWVDAPLQPFTGCHLTGVIFSEASAVTVIFPVFRKCWCCLLVGCQVLLGNMCWDYFRRSHHQSAHQSRLWGCFKSVWTTAASQSPPASQCRGSASTRRLKGHMQIILLRNSCHAGLGWAHPSPLQSLGKGMTFKRSGPGLGSLSGFVMKASSEMVPRKRSRAKRSPSPTCWLAAGVWATGLLLHFMLASPKKQLQVCIPWGTLTV